MAETRTSRLACRVVSLEDATHDVRVVHLEVAGGGHLDFAAGQYAKVSFGQLPPRDYSMANRPDEACLEFHIRRMGDDGASDYATRVLALDDPVVVEAPYGDAWLREDHKGPILAVAGGSGLAPIKSIVETALARGMTQAIHLYFGVRGERDLYLEDRFRALARRHGNLNFVLVLSDPRGPGDRRSGLMRDVLAADFRDLAGFKAYLAGPPVMVEAAVGLLARRGLHAGDIHADPFYSEAEQAVRKGTP